MDNVIAADWPAPSRIKAYTTTRQGGVSQSPFTSLNLAAHVGDELEAVHQNREALRRLLQLPSEPVWLKQTHSNIVVDANNAPNNPEADASFTQQGGVVCAVLTADCLPILLCDKQGIEIAAIHAGWKGILNGVIEQTVQTMYAEPQEILAWLGPAIGPAGFEVKQDVYSQFVTADSHAKQAFESISDNSWSANIYTLGTQRLNKAGVSAIFGGNLCTYTDFERFYSYRRDNNTGRMASLIWFE